MGYSRTPLLPRSSHIEHQCTAPEYLSQSGRHKAGRPSDISLVCSVRHCVQSQGGGVLLGSQTQVLNAGRLAVVAGEAAGS